MPRLRTTRAPFGVVAADSLRRLEDLLAHNRGDRNRDPLLTRTPHLMGAFLCSTGNDGFCAVEVRAPHVRFVAQEPSNSGTTPNVPPTRRRNAVVVQVSRDLSNRHVLLYILLEDAAYHACLRLIDFQVRGLRRRSRDAPIAVGTLPGNHLTGPRAPEFSAPITFPDLGALVFSDYSLHLLQQLRLGITVELRRIVKQHFDAAASQLVEDNNLICSAPCKGTVFQWVRIPPGKCRSSR